MSNNDDYNLDFSAIKAKYNLNEDQMNSFKIMLNNNFVFLTGQAGTGKSYLLNSYIDFIKNLGGGVMVTAPTGVAALLLHGSTLHRTFRIPVPIKQAHYSKDEIMGILCDGKKSRLLDKLAYTDILVIDEISMCRIDVFEYVMNIIKVYNEMTPNNIVKVVLCGDFLQLPPVLGEHEKKYFKELRGNENIFPFQSSLWRELNFKTTELSTIVRQDGESEFAKNLNKARVGDKSCISYFNQFAYNKIDENAIKISGTNKSVDETNNICNEKIQGKMTVYKSTKTGDVKEGDKPTADKLELKVGTRVMSVINDSTSLRYSNGSLGTVVGFGINGVKVQFDSFYGPIEIEPYTWKMLKYEVKKEVTKDGKTIKKLSQIEVGSFTQLPLKLAFAVTIHKSQGQTYDEAEIAPFCWDYGQLYVALSRCKSEENLSLSYPIYEKYLKANPDVISFLEKNNSSIEKAGNHLSKSAKLMLDRIRKRAEKGEIEDDNGEEDYNNDIENEDAEDSDYGIFSYKDGLGEILEKARKEKEAEEKARTSKGPEKEYTNKSATIVHTDLITKKETKEEKEIRLKREVELFMQRAEFADLKELRRERRELGRQKASLIRDIYRLNKELEKLSEEVEVHR